MPEKRCVTCHHVRPLTDFNVRRAAHDGLQSRCRSCSRQWYVENRAAHRANVQRRNTRVREENKARLGAYFLTHPCVDCGESDPRVLELDHEGDLPKVNAVGTMLARGDTWARIEAEIAKCSVRCANCHRRITSTRAEDWRHRFFLAQAEGRGSFDPAERLSRLLG